MKLLYLTLLLTIILVTIAKLTIKNGSRSPFFMSKTLVYAEDDESGTSTEAASTDEVDSKTTTSTTKSNSPSSTTQTSVPAVPPKPKYITLIDTGYNTDTDGDGLVDAIDPDPTIPQQQFFTDSDNDGVPDAFDKHPGENDFSYVDFTDTNNNGILDSLEGL